MKSFKFSELASFNVCGSTRRHENSRAEGSTFTLRSPFWALKFSQGTGLKNTLTFELSLQSFKKLSSNYDLWLNWENSRKSNKFLNDSKVGAKLRSQRHVSDFTGIRSSWWRTMMQINCKRLQVSSDCNECINNCF